MIQSCNQKQEVHSTQVAQISVQRKDPIDDVQPLIRKEQEESGKRNKEFLELCMQNVLSVLITQS